MTPAETAGGVGRVRLALAALLVYVATRLVSTAFIAQSVPRQVPFEQWTGPKVTFLDMSVLWDGSWYRHIVENGYPDQLPLDAVGNVAQNAWAFYPLFPELVGRLMGLTGADFRLAATLVSLVAGAGAAVLMVHLFARYAPAPVALAAMTVWAVQPAAPTLQIAYTEALAMLILVGLLTSLIDRRWGAVAVLAVLLGLTRPIAVPVAAVVGVVVLREVLAWWRERPGRPAHTLVEPVAALAVTGLSAVLWPTFVGLRTGRSDAYSETMSSWRAGHEIVPLRPWIDNTAVLLFADSARPRLYAALAVGLLVAFLIAAAVGPWAYRLPMELRLWMLAYPAYLAVVLDVGTSLIRYAIPLFPVALVIIGGGLRRIPRWWPALAALLIVAFLWGQWHWTMGLLVFEPPSGYPP
ncbi:hypothetical protein GA707_01690 [Nostocoides sp. F2B08]|uniref:hypothetical protein n=1 Tax=Nostocoides sp. F2B08 TaxID=2653936 RepID=UPI001263BD9D|nr:hypothetical protein [Tetrasphaera sp. F2B08]KAB7746258.1 hypothetical protein GA707_01690 [Tetrasphaera sp. F2B08]